MYIYARKQTADLFFNVMSSNLNFIPHFIWCIVIDDDEKDVFENKRKEKEQLTLQLPFSSC